MQGVQWMKVVLLPHDSAWDDEFLKVRSLISGVWGDSVIDIQHVGSTAVAGIYAKPILDVAVVVRSFAEMDVAAMEAAGYRYMGARTADADRHMFARLTSESGDDEIVLQHIHCYEPGSRGYADLIGFRDYLNSHPEVAEEYDGIKRRMAARHPDDRYAYSDGKRAFIEKIIRKIREDGDQTDRQL